MIDELLNSGTPPHQDFIILERKKSPGRATVVGAGSPRTWNKNKGYGMSGASLTFTGLDLSEFDVLLELWTDAHWREWADFSTVLDKVPDKASKVSPSRPLQIVHPALNRPPWRITQVGVRDVLTPEQDDDGMWVIRLMLTAYAAPKPAIGKLSGSIPKPDSVNPLADDPELAALMRKIEVLERQP